VYLEITVITFYNKIRGRVRTMNIRTLKVIKNIKSQKSIKKKFHILIIQNVIGNIRTFLPKNLFDVLILPMASEKIRMLKVAKMAYYLWLPRPVGG
jgi:hypothetical protein